MTEARPTPFFSFIVPEPRGISSSSTLRLMRPSLSNTTERRTVRKKEYFSSLTSAAAPSGFTAAARKFTARPGAALSGSSMPVIVSDGYHGTTIVL